MTEPENQVEQPSPATNGTSTTELETLRARAENAEKERDQYLALVRSTRAELENDLKRARRSFEEERKYAVLPFAAALLPVLDNLERAMAEAKRVGETGPLVQGVAMVLTQLRDVLKRNGITPIEALGKSFDPNLHQAVVQQPTADKPPMTVLQVLEQGYTIHDRVLRPASVAVAAAPTPDEQKKES